MAGRPRLPVRNRSCAAASLDRSRSPRVIGPSSWRSPGADRSPSTRSSTLGPSWRSPRANGSRTSPSRCGAIHPPSGASVAAMSKEASIGSWPTCLAAGAPRRFPPLQRARIVELACLEPVAEGLHITHWSGADLARRAVAAGIVPSISPATVRRILDEVHLQPHRTRYWRTARLDERFKDRAEKVLWCYANARRLAHKGLWTVAVDEVPNFQVLERRPIRRAEPGSIEQREFEYIRHGTVNLLLFLVVHTGRMEPAVLESKDAEHYIEQLRLFRRRHRRLAGAFLIQDGDPSHVTCGAPRGSAASSSSITPSSPGRNTTSSMPTHSSGRGAPSRCEDGSTSTSPESLARLRSRSTRTEVTAAAPEAGPRGEPAPRCG
jgi:Homeodomain-like domain